MNKYQEITAARKILDLPETATMKSIKASYRRLLREWHPDRCTENPATCFEMTRKIIASYQTISRGDLCKGARRPSDNF